VQNDEPFTLLIVEDDAGVARLQQLRLERAGYDVVVVSNAAQALAAVDADSLDLLILDHHLPGGVDGLELYRRVKAAGYNIPAILVTAATSDGIVLEALRAGVQDCVPKNADFLDYLQATVARVLKARLTEKLLAQSEVRLAAIISSVLDAVLTVDEYGCIDLCNPAAERMFHCRARTAINQPVRALLPAWPVDPAGLDKLAAQTVPWEAEGRRSDGQLFPVEVSVAFSEATGRRFWTVVARDVSERRKVQEQRERLLLEKAARREAEAARTLIEAEAKEKARLYQELREADRRKDEFLAMLSHELRNPLAPIRHVLQLIRLSGRDIDSAVRHNWVIVERQVEQLVRLVDDLLDISRISRGKIALQKQHVDLASILRQAEESSRPLFKSRKHTLEISIPAEPLPLRADPLRLVQVFANLLNNAAKYTPEGGRIDLAAGSVAGQAEVRVRDSGVGIPAAMLPRVFDLFTQMERTLDRSEGGLGIGLTLVRELTRLHGGTVEAQSAGPGQGSEFIVRLPLVEAAALAPGETAEPRPARMPPSAPAAQRAVLVVDDNLDSANTLARLLHRLGHTVKTAGNGQQAFSVLEVFEPDIVILDIGLPGMDGYELARRLRADRRFEQTVLVALTGYGSPEDRRRSHEAGFHVHLVKPTDLAGLQEVLAAPQLVRGTED
jgi:PAS domain S-box-containing protein